MDKECPDCGHQLIKYGRNYFCKICNIEYKQIKGNLIDVAGEY